jgi:hypothetical protein
MVTPVLSMCRWSNPLFLFIFSLYLLWLGIRSGRLLGGIELLLGAAKLVFRSGSMAYCSGLPTCTRYSTIGFLSSA